MNSYYEISEKSTIFENIKNHAFNDNDPWTRYYNFDAKLISNDLLLEDNFFKFLNKYLKFKAGILKLDPYTCYDWHKDDRRGVAINMLISNAGRSFCVFSKNKNGMSFKIEELKYSPEKYYLFNTQIHHTVYNFENIRYLLSVEFEKDKNELDFETVLKLIKLNYEKQL